LPGLLAGIRTAKRADNESVEIFGVVECDRNGHLSLPFGCHAVALLFQECVGCGGRGYFRERPDNAVDHLGTLHTLDIPGSFPRESLSEPGDFIESLTGNPLNGWIACMMPEHL
jgi:hypothetical protein